MFLYHRVIKKNVTTQKLQDKERMKVKKRVLSFSLLKPVKHRRREQTSFSSILIKFNLLRFSFERGRETERERELIIQNGF